MDSGLRGPFLVNGRYYVFMTFEKRLRCYQSSNVLDSWHEVDAENAPKARGVDLVVGSRSDSPSNFNVWYTAPDGFMSRAIFHTGEGRWVYTETKVETQSED